MSVYINTACTLPPTAGSTAPLQPPLLLRESRSLGQRCCVWGLGCSRVHGELGKAPTYQAWFFSPYFPGMHPGPCHVSVAVAPLAVGLRGCDPRGPRSCTPCAMGAVAPGAVAVVLHDSVAKECPEDPQQGPGLLSCCSPWVSPLSSRSPYSDACSVSSPMGDRVPGERRQRGQEHSWFRHVPAAPCACKGFPLMLWLRRKGGFLEHAQPWPFPPCFISPAATTSIKSQQITGALGSYWDIIRVLVHFSGCFPIRGGTARIMDGADVWRKGVFGLLGQLMPFAGQCRGAKSVILGMGDGETSSGSSPSGAPAPDCSSLLGPNACPEGEVARSAPKEQLTAMSLLLSLNSSASAGARWEQQV